ncbi:MAG: AAA family ATPase, partial [Clostridia bacterium]|nr:AAA family ATPase [Clostridia bacterium]
EILKLCETERSLKEIAKYFGYKDVYKFKNNYLKPLLEQGKLQTTIPEQPKNRNQKYISKQ